MNALHNVGQHGTASGDEHDSALDNKVIIYDPFHCHIDQHASHQPNGKHRQQSTQDF